LPRPLAGQSGILQQEMHFARRRSVCSMARSAPATSGGDHAHVIKSIPTRCALGAMLGSSCGHGRARAWPGADDQSVSFFFHRRRLRRSTPPASAIAGKATVFRQTSHSATLACESWRVPQSRMAAMTENKKLYLTVRPILDMAERRRNPCESISPDAVSAFIRGLSPRGADSEGR